MHILMTGGTGLIGERFIRHFDQYKYTVLSRSIDRARQQLPAAVCIIDDLHTLDNLNEFDAVINLAGEPIIDKRWSRSQKEKIRHSRWDTTEHLVTLFGASDNAPKVFVSGSAIGFYGASDGRVLVESDVASTSDFSHQLCQQWEAVAERAAPYTRVVLLRTGIVLDREGGALEKMLTPFKFGVGGRIGNGRQIMSWIHIHDMIDAIHFLLISEGLSGPFNITAPGSVSNQQFTDQLAQTLGRKAVIPVPSLLLKVLLGESSQLLLGSQNVSPEKLQQANFRFSFSGLESALRDLIQD